MFLDGDFGLKPTPVRRYNSAAVTIADKESKGTVPMRQPIVFKLQSE